MRRRKKDTEENSDNNNAVAVADATHPADQSQAEPENGPAADEINERPQRIWARSFRSVLNLPTKGVTIGRRDGHDWVIGFPDAPNPEIKQQLADVGFTYRSRDKRWTTFTHAPNRPQVESLAKKLLAEYGDKLFIADYPVQQVVIAFQSKPSEEVMAELKDHGFHYRPDQTWNADYTPESHDFARDFAMSMPDTGISIGR